MSGASAASRCSPCRCLCLGTLSQTTKTLPRRRTMRHASHSLRTELRTCGAGRQSGGGARTACEARAFIERRSARRRGVCEFWRSTPALFSLLVGGGERRAVSLSCHVSASSKCVAVSPPLCTLSAASTHRVSSCLCSHLRCPCTHTFAAPRAEPQRAHVGAQARDGGGPGQVRGQRRASEASGRPRRRVLPSCARAVPALAHAQTRAAWAQRAACSAVLVRELCWRALGES